MKALFYLSILLLTCSLAVGQSVVISGNALMTGNGAFGTVAPGGGGGGGGTTELADNFTEASDTDLTNHVTTTGSFAWQRASTGGDFTNFTATANAKDMHVTQGSLFSVNHTMSSADHTVQCDVSYPNNTDSVEATIGGRYNGAAVGSATAYLVTWFPNSQVCAMYKTVAGTVTQLGSNLSSAGTSHTLKLVMSGTTITGYSDGVQIASVTDSSVAGPGKCAIGPGLRNGGRTGSNGSNHCAYDNLQVTVP